MARTVTLQVRGERELAKALDRAEDATVDALAGGLFQEAETVMSLSKPRVPVDEGVLRNSGFVDMPVRTPDGVSVDLGYGGAAKGYARFVHDGTGPAVGRPPFSPPPSAFEGWAARVLGDANLAFVVARAVGRKGTKPTRFLEIPLVERSKQMAKRLADHVRQRLGSRIR